MVFIMILLCHPWGGGGERGGGGGASYYARGREGVCQITTRAKEAQHNLLHSLTKNREKWGCSIKVKKCVT